MKDWRDYTTNIDASSSLSNAWQENAARTDTPKSFPKAWLYFNYFLVGLCCLSLIFGLVGTIRLCIIRDLANDNFLTTAIENTCLSFVYPGLLLLWMYVLLTTGSGFQYGAGLGVVAYSMIISAVLGVGLIINAIMACITKKQYRHDPVAYRIATKNARIALTPPIFISTMLILLLFVL